MPTLVALQSEANELEMELLMELRSQLLQRAATIYSSLEKEGWLEDDSPAGDKAAWQQAADAAEDSEEDEEVGDSTEDSMHFTTSPDQQTVDARFVGSEWVHVSLCPAAVFFSVHFTPQHVVQNPACQLEQLNTQYFLVNGHREGHGCTYGHGHS